MQLLIKMTLLDTYSQNDCKGLKTGPMEEIQSGSSVPRCLDPAFSHRSNRDRSSDDNIIQIIYQKCTSCLYYQLPSVPPAKAAHLPHFRPFLSDISFSLQMHFPRLNTTSWRMPLLIFFLPSISSLIFFCNGEKITSPGHDYR